MQIDNSPADRPNGGLPPIPEELEYLVEPGIQYGKKYHFDDAVQWFLENADESDFETLAALAERARLAGDYQRFLKWSEEVDDVLERIVDERYPYTIDLSEQQREEYLRLINPSLAEHLREKGVRLLAETNDRSEVAERRREMRGRQLTEANDQVHHMDIYFLFGLMDACDMKFQSD